MHRASSIDKNWKVQVLVAMDIAARGLDISELPQVVNYELPHVPEDYVHRIGRTGRAGCAGQALSLVSDDERDRLHAIERGLGKRISVLPLDRSNVKVVERSDGGANCLDERPQVRQLVVAGQNDADLSSVGRHANWFDSWVRGTTANCERAALWQFTTRTATANRRGRELRSPTGKPTSQQTPFAPCVVGA